MRQALCTRAALSLGVYASSPAPNMPPRRRRLTFEWAGKLHVAGDYAVPGPLWRVLQEAARIVLDGGSSSSGPSSAATAAALAVPPGAPGAAFLAALASEAARDNAWASGKEAQLAVAGLLGWVVANADEVMGQAETSAGAEAAAAVSGGASAAGGGEPPGAVGGRYGLNVAPSGRIRVQFNWRLRMYNSSLHLTLDAATAAACVDIARITVRGREAAIVTRNFRGLNFPPDGPAPNDYIAALLAVAPADDARWLAGSWAPRHAEAFAAAHGAIAAYLAHIGHASAAAAAAVSMGERLQAGYAGITDAKGHSRVQLQWRGRKYFSGTCVVLDAATAAACADVARITLRGREATTVKGNRRGLNFPPDGPAPNDYITALLAVAPADDARWLAAGSGAPRHEAAFAAADGAIAAYLAHIRHASAAAAGKRARATAPVQ